MGAGCCHHASYREEEPSQLHHLGQMYSVNAILKISRKKKTIYVPLKELDIAPFDELDHERVIRANYNIPIVVLADETTILDGMHRAAHARLDGLTMIPVRVITAKELERTRV